VTSEPGEILSEFQWLRRLAERLARDGATAEDLLQELWLQARQRGPSEPARRGPWLARVLANLARRERRGAARRRARELASARPEASPGTHEVAERLEAQRLLLEELERLEEPLRSVLVLRFQDGLSSAEIARRLSLPSGTVRWRVHEGLGRLRERLDRRHGGERERWVRACAPLLLSHPVGAHPLWPFALGLAMNAGTKLGIAAAALAMIALPVWLAARAEPGDAEALAVAALTATSSELMPPRELPEAGALPPAGRRMESTAAGTLEPAEPAVEPWARLEGRVLGEAGRALATAELEAENEGVAGLRAACGPDGRFELELGTDPEASLVLRARAPGHASQLLRVQPLAGRTVQVGEIRLAAGGRVSGWVRGADGSPARDVRVVAARPRPEPSGDDLWGPLLEPESAEARTHGDGRFELEGAPVGMVAVWALRPGADVDDTDARSDWVRCAPFALAAREARDGLELVLPGREGLPATALAGVVRTPARAPVPHARIRVDARHAGGSFQEELVADERGAFTYDAHQPCVATLEARDAEDSCDAWRPARLVGVRSGTQALELVLGEPRCIELAVASASGEAVEEFRVLVRRVFPNGARAWPRTFDGSAGSLRLGLPIDPFALEVEAPGFARADLGVIEPEHAPRELACRLEPLPGLRGRVTHAGAPVAGARLELFAAAPEGQHVERHGFPLRLWYEPEESTTSDAEGRFLLTGRTAGERVILCLAQGFALAELGPLQVEPEHGRDELAFELTRGGALEGVVRTAPGVGAAGLVVGANRFDGHPRTQRTDAEGRFRFEGLTPGPWRVERVRDELDPSDENFLVDELRAAPDPRLEPNCVVREGETSAFTLDLSRERPAVLAALVSVNGAPAAGWSLVLWPVGVNTFMGDLPGGTLDERGELRVEVEPGRYYLRAKHPTESDFHGVGEIEVELAPGETPYELELETAALSGRYSGDPTDVLALWKARAANGLAAQSILRLDETGRFARGVLLAGKGELVLLRSRPDGTRSELARRALELEAGAELHVELP
jgi:RNA polymerase sigma factor (sigma-70 family)